MRPLFEEVSWSRLPCLIQSFLTARKQLKVIIVALLIFLTLFGRRILGETWERVKIWAKMFLLNENGHEKNILWLSDIVRFEINLETKLNFQWIVKKWCMIDLTVIKDNKSYSYLQGVPITTGFFSMARCSYKSIFTALLCRQWTDFYVGIIHGNINFFK